MSSPSNVFRRLGGGIMVALAGVALTFSLAGAPALLGTQEEVTFSDPNLAALLLR